jgi:hypothetical protein
MEAGPQFSEGKFKKILGGVIIFYAKDKRVWRVK